MSRNGRLDTGYTSAMNVCLLDWERRVNLLRYVSTKKTWAYIIVDNKEMCHKNWYISEFSSLKMNNAMESSRCSWNVSKYLLEMRCQYFNPLTTNDTYSGLPHR